LNSASCSLGAKGACAGGVHSNLGMDTSLGAAPSSHRYFRLPSLPITFLHATFHATRRTCAGIRDHHSAGHSRRPFPSPASWTSMEMIPVVSFPRRAIAFRATGKRNAHCEKANPRGRRWRSFLREASSVIGV
jgi:hypothetical protein